MSLEDLYPDLKHKNPRLRESAMRQIVQERTDETIPLLMTILADEDVVARRMAVQTLGIIGFEAVPSLAQQLTTSEKATVRSGCAEALAMLALNFSEETFPTDALAALQIALHDPNPVVKICAVGALSTIGAPALDILMAAIAMEDLAVRVAVMGALGSIGDSRAAEVLSNAANDQTADSYSRESAASALSRLQQVNQFNSRHQPRQNPQNT